jgi:nucleoid-associated protein YgaU
MISSLTSTVRRFATVIMIISALGYAMALDHQSFEPVGERTYTVKPGDTLYAIALRHYEGDPREAVWKISEQNALDSSRIVPGQQLTLP